MDKSSKNGFKEGHPCEDCIVRPMCKIIRGEYDGSCDLPEKYEYWLFDEEIKRLKKLERSALKGDREAIIQITKSAIDSLKLRKKVLRSRNKIRKKYL